MQVEHFVSLSGRRLIALAVASVVTGLASNSQALPYTYTESTPTTTQWAAGTSWDATPVSAADTILNFNGTLAAGDALVSNNDIVGNFLLNQFNFNYAGPASGTAPTVTVTGNPLEFSNPSARIYYNSTVSAAAASRPQLIINNNIALTADLSVRVQSSGGKPEITLNGAITGNNSVTFTAQAGQTATMAISNTGNDYTGDTRLTLSTTSGRDTALRLDASGVIPNGAGRGNLFLDSVNEAGTLIVLLNGNIETINGLSSGVPGKTTSASVHSIRNGAAGPATLTMGDNNATASFVGSIIDGGAGVLNLNKIGDGVQSLAGGGTFTGSTTVSDGTLEIDFTRYATGQTATPTNYFSSTSDVTLAGGTTFAINGRRDGAAISESAIAVSSGSRTFSLPNAQASQLVVGQLMTFTKNSGTGTVPATAYITAIDPAGPTTTTIYASARVANSGGGECCLGHHRHRRQHLADP